MKNINCPDVYRLYSQLMKESYNVVYLYNATAVIFTLIQYFINKLLQITIIYYAQLFCYKIIWWGNV